MSLAANFGELRPDHYHMGLDIRTQHRENLPVFAAADGYVARVSVAPFGFGQAVYVVHPNGYTTVYGHLNRFFPALAAYVHKEQYRRQSWQLNLELPPALFPVKKGGLIAYSGNTGGSQGPHLHFEIRRTAGDMNLNPLLFNLPVEDHTAPAIVKLAWYDRNQGIYEQSPHLLPVRISGPRVAWGPSANAYTGYTLPAGLLTVPTSRISFAIQAFDTQSGSTNPNGIFEADLYEDDRPVIGFRMDRISYDNTRNINAHIDYRTRQRGGAFLQHLSFLPGYPFPSIYSAAVNPGSGRFADPSAPQKNEGGEHPANGVLDIGDGRPHRVLIRVRDTEDNSCSLVFTVQYRPSNEPGLLSADSPGQPGKRFYPGMIDGLEIPGCAFYLAEKSLYDSVVIGATVTGYPGSGNTLLQGISHTYTIGAPWIPLLEPVLVRLQDERAMRPDSLTGAPVSREKVLMACFNGSQVDLQRVEWHEGWASARFHQFGNFQLVEDTIPPVITALSPLEGADLGKASRILLSAKDDLGVVRNFRAELDGDWICFTNDKERAYIYTFDEHCPRGAHTLKISVEDLAGNRTVKEYHFTR
jgi:murein DD-endopeptidase MepM/ murein hydrolase activator NlpD